jgi:hypothetical protein
MLIKQLLAQKKQLEIEFKEKRDEFNKYKDSCRDEEEKIMNMLIKKIPKIKLKAVNILSDLYPEIHFELTFLPTKRGVKFESYVVLKVFKEDIIKITNDLIEQKAIITECYTYTAPNVIKISTSEETFELDIRNNVYVIKNLNREHKFYKLYRTVKKMNDITDLSFITK